jgi:hypothetical protein
MVTKYAWLCADDAIRVGSDPSVPSAIATQALQMGSEMGFLKTIEVPTGYTAIASIRFYYRRTGTGNLYLKFPTAFTASGGGVPVEDNTDAYTVYNEPVADSSTRYVTVPVAAYNALTSMVAGDTLSIAGYRGADDPTDTYSTDLDVIGFRIAFTIGSISGAVISPSTNAIIELDEIKDFLKIPLATTDDDDFLQLAINNQSNWIESQIRNKVKSQLISDEYSYWTGRQRIRTKYFPIVSLTVLKYLNTAGTWTDLLTTIGDAILNNPDNEFSNANNSFHVELPDVYTSPSLISTNALNVKISYNAGYATIPAEIHDVCLERVVDFYKRSARGGGRFGKESESISGMASGGSTRYIDFSPKHKEMLKPYVRRYE